MYFLNRTFNRGHEAGERNGHGHAFVDRIGIGIAVILLQTHLRIVGKRCHLAAADLIARLIAYNIDDLAGIGHGEIEARDVLIGGGKLLFKALHAVARGLHRRFRTGRIDGEQGITRGDSLALGNEHVEHRTGGRKRKRFARLGLGDAAALHHGGDRAVTDDVGHHFAFAAAAAFLAAEFECGKNERNDQNKRNDALPDGFFLLFLHKRSGGRSRRRGLLHAFFLLFQYFVHGNFLSVS